MSERDLLEGLNDSLSIEDLMRVPESQGLAEQDARLARLRGEPGAQERSIRAPDLDDDLVENVKKFEGYEAVPKWDYKQYSSGWGTRAQPGERLSREEHDQRLRSELGKAAEFVDAQVPDLPEGVRKAMISLTFNAGGDWAKSGLGSQLRQGDYEGAQRTFLQYNKAGGQTLSGLQDRRTAEAAWFGPGSYDTEDRTAVGLGGSRAYAPEVATVPDTGRRKMDQEPRGILDFLTGGQQLQGQPQGGLLGMLGDPETMSYLAMMLKGASPYSNLDPNSMLQNAQTLAMRRQIELQRQRENAIDNRRADEALGLRRQEYGEGRKEREAREADRIQLKRDAIEQQARDRKANADALKVLGIPTATSPEDAAEPPGPQSSLPDAYTPPDISPTATASDTYTPPDVSPAAATAMASAPEEIMAGGAIAQPAASNRDDQLRERIKNLTEAYQREGLKDSTRKLIADEIKATNDKIGVPEGKDPKEWKKLKTKSEFTKQERAGEQAVESNLVIDEINRASKLVTPGAPTTAIGKAARDIGIDTSPPTAGAIGEWAQYIGGTPARSLRENLATISGHVTVESLQKMREASPSGGALGNISNFEDKLLGSLKGSLNQGLAPKELQYNLNRLRNYTHAVASGMQITPQNAQAVLSGASIKQEAMEAIASGKNKGQVLQRLQEYGIDTRGLE